MSVTLDTRGERLTLVQVVIRLLTLVRFVRYLRDLDILLHLDSVDIPPALGRGLLLREELEQGLIRVVLLIILQLPGVDIQETFVQFGFDDEGSSGEMGGARLDGLQVQDPVLDGLHEIDHLLVIGGGLEELELGADLLGQRRFSSVVGVQDGPAVGHRGALGDLGLGFGR